MPRILAPDGTIREFPDDMSMADIGEVMAREFPKPSAAQAPRKAEPGSARAAPPARRGIPGTPSNPIPLTQDNQSIIRAGQYFTHKGKVYRQQAGAPAPGAPPSTALGAGVRSASREVLPTATSLAGAGMGFTTGAALGAAVGAPLPPVVPFTTLIGGLAGGLYGAYAGHKAGEAGQSLVAGYVPSDVKQRFGQNEAQIREDVRAHPTAVAVGAAAPSLMSGRPSKKAAELALGAALSGGSELAREIHAGEKLDPVRLGALTAIGAATSAPNRLTSFAFGTPETQLQRGLRERVQGPGRRAQGSADAISRDMRETRGALQEVGVKPAPVDVLDPLLTKQVLSPAVAASPEGARLVTRYGAEVAGPGISGTQASAQRAVQQSVPEMPGTTAQDLRRMAEEEIRSASESVVPGVRLGEASTAISQRLIGEEQAAKKAMQDAYAKQETVPPSEIVFDDLVAAGFRKMDPSEAQALRLPALGEGQVRYRNPETGEIVAGPAVAPKAEAFTASLQQSVGTFPDNEIGPVRQVLGDLAEKAKGRMSTADYLDARRKLSAIERDNGPQTPAGAAATKARQALDAQIIDLGDQGRLSGSPEALTSIQTALDTARKYYGAFRSGDIREALTTYNFSPDGKTPAIDPEAARRTIFSALGDRNTSLQNLKALRAHLGPDSPEWAALRQEAVEQLVGGKNLDKAGPLAALEKFERENPAMADLLFTPDQRQAFVEAQERVTGAQATQAGLRVGETAMQTDMLPADFAENLRALGPKERRAAKIAMRSDLEGMLGSPAGASRALELLNTGTTARANITSLLGAKEADTLFRKAKAITQRAERAAEAASAAGRAQEPAVTGALIRAGEQLSNRMPFLGNLTRYLEGRGMNSAQALQLAQDALDPAKTDDTIDFIERLYGENTAQAFLRRVRANSQQMPIIGNLANRIVRQSAVTLNAPAGEPAGGRVEEVMAPQIDVTEEGDTSKSTEELLKSWGVEDTAPIAPEDINAAPSVPAPTVSFVSQLTPQEVRALTIVAEASPDFDEMRGVGHVLYNREGRPDRYGNSIYDVVLGGEFDAFKTNPGSLEELMSSDRFKRALDIVNRIEQGDEDPTGGATHFLAPGAMKRPKEKWPAWGQDLSKGVRLGQTVFFTGVD